MRVPERCVSVQHGVSEAGRNAGLALFLASQCPKPGILPWTGQNPAALPRCEVARLTRLLGDGQGPIDMVCGVGVRLPIGHL